MKAETKELIEDIKKRLFGLAVKTPVENMMGFLDSLPGLEEQLRHGGYIPDCNNKPCKSGDWVFYRLPSGEWKKGMLKWSSFFNRFVVDDGLCVFSSEIKKAE